MLKLKGYKIENTIFSGSNTKVYSGVRENDQASIAIKVLSSDSPSYDSIVKLKFEYEITQKLDIDGVAKAFELEKVKGRYAFVMEHVKQKSLTSILKQQKLPLPTILKIGIQTAEILGKIHERNIIHKDINPNNILADIEQASVTIIDFGISSELSRENPVIKNPNLLEGTLPYISPEQTGRMNRPIGYHTDYYSLGITLYELLTGTLPFKFQDTLELIHAHIAKQPPPPHKVNSQVPRMVSEIVMKLMAKTAEERYQSSHGIIKDLENCLEQIEEKGSIDNFFLGQTDISSTFLIPSRLYGRETEIGVIMNAYDLISKGEGALLTVSGYSGVGKSALVNEVQKPIVKNKGYFISGKFDQFQKNVPYSSLIQAFQELIRQILTETEEQINAWKDKLLTALGTNGQVIINIIPELELIIGKQPPLIELGAMESKNRFNIVFQNFTRVFAKKEHPLVLFLDDLQWADSASLELIKQLSAESAGGYLFFMLAYRDNEIDEAHPLTEMLGGIAQAGTSITNLSLKPLSLDTVNQIVADTLKCSIDKASVLSQVVHRKTLGNPFFVNEFLKFLHQEQFIEFDTIVGEWSWNLDKIQEANITDNMLELMLKKINKLDEKAKNALKYAACIGNRFDLNTLTVISQQDAASLSKSLWEVMQEGFIVPIGDNYKYIHLVDGQGENEVSDDRISYKFLHDKVQQAAYALIDDSEKAQIHLQVGRLLQNQYGSNKANKNLFDILNHLNYASELITDEEERIGIAGLNLLAGNKAKYSAAYAPAIKYLGHSLAFLPDNSWETHHSLNLSIHEALTEAHFLNTHYDLAQTTADNTLLKVTDTLDKIKLYEIKIQAHVAMGAFVEAIDTALEVLAELGITVPKNPGMPEFGESLGKTKALTDGLSSEELENLPVLTDKSKIAALQIINHTFLAAYLAIPFLHPILTFKVIRICVREGNSVFAPFAYSLYGYVNGAIGDLDASEKFGNLALTLLDKMQVNEFRCSILQNVSSGVFHHKKPYKKVVAIFRDSIKHGLDTGDLIFTGLSAMHLCSMMFLNSELLDTTMKEMVKNARLTKKLQQIRFHSINAYLLLASRLSGTDNKEVATTLAGFNEEESLQLMLTVKSYSEVCMFYLARIKGHVYFREHEQALEQLNQVMPFAQSLMGSFYQEELNFYGSLVLLASAAKITDPEEKEKLLTQVGENQKMMGLWAQHCPQNYQSKYLLVEAELARVNGTEHIHDLYDQAIEVADENANTQIEALGNELAGEYFMALGKKKFAKIYFQDAHSNYTLWGAKAKTTHLEQVHPYLVHKMSAPKGVMTTTTIGETNSGSLDLATILKASQTLSQEVKFSNLIGKMLQVVLESSGAQRGVLIDNDNGKLVVLAQSNVEVGSEVLSDNALAKEGDFSQTIVNYVARTKETLLLGDAMNEERYAKDSYIRSKKPRSILCLPILRQGKLSVIFYLENRLVANTFTPERLEVLKMLSSQIVISIENSLLYENLEDKVKERTQELVYKNEEISAASEILKDLNGQLQEKNKHVAASINYAQRIQQALLPFEEQMLISLPEHFVFFRPRDVVSGDFYWFKDIDDKIFIVAGDCTGHGVPGAFMTMLGSQALTNIIVQKKVHSPEQILQALDEAIRVMLRSEHAGVSDGMDIVIAVMDKKKKELQFSGAKNPLALIRNNELEIIKGDIYSINGYRKKGIAGKFTLHTFDLSEPLTFYLYSDGVQDQFGGKEGRKFTRKRLREILLKNYQRPMSEQKQAVSVAVDDWMQTESPDRTGGHDQIDDMLLIGVHTTPDMFS